MKKEESRPASSRLGALSAQVFVSTALKAVLWLALAWGITRFHPAATWAWYAALALIAIGVLASFFIFGMAIVARRRENATIAHSN